MRIEYRVGDLLAQGPRVICHGCNAQAKMGSGIALAVRERFPRAYEAYMEAARVGRLRVGQAIWAVCGPERTIVNAITQEFYGNAARTGEVYVDYEGVRAALRRIEAMAGGGCLDQFGEPVGKFDAVGFPLIGAGLAGGSWKRISGIIEEESRSFQPVVHTLDGHVPTT